MIIYFVIVYKIKLPRNKIRNIFNNYNMIKNIMCPIFGDIFGDIFAEKNKNL